MFFDRRWLLAYNVERSSSFGNDTEIATSLNFYFSLLIFRFFPLLCSLLFPASRLLIQTGYLRRLLKLPSSRRLEATSSWFRHRDSFPAHTPLKIAPLFGQMKLVPLYLSVTFIFLLPPLCVKSHLISYLTRASPLIDILLFLESTPVFTFGRASVTITHPGRKPALDR